MNNLIEMSGEITMSSREIAELVGKEHKHVMRDLRVMSEQLGDMFEGVVQIWTHQQNKQQYEEYAIKRDTCITLLTGYDSVSRMKVIKRWQELESAQKPAIPQTYAAALLEAGRLALELEQKGAQLAIAAPKAEFVDKYVQSTGNLGFRQVAKLLKVKETELREFLISNRVMYRLGGALTPYAEHIDAGRFEVKAVMADHGDATHAYQQAKLTPKGVEWLAGELAKAEAKKKNGGDVMCDKFEQLVSVEDGADMVSNPSHYADSAIECIDAIAASMSSEAFLGYLKGNVQKYVWRYEKKAKPAEDLKKARWYLDRLISELELADD